MNFNLKHTGFLVLLQKQRCVSLLIPHCDVAWYIVEKWLWHLFDLFNYHGRIISKRLVIQQMDPWWFHVCNYDIIFKLVLVLWCHKKRHHYQNTTLVFKLAKLVWYYFTYALNSNPVFVIRDVKSFLRKFFVIYQNFLIVGFGYRFRIFAMIGVQKCQFLVKSDNWTNWHVCYHANWLWIMNFWYVYTVWTFLWIFVILIRNRAGFAVCGPNSLW